MRLGTTRHELRNGESVMNVPTCCSRERFRARFEAWEAQIYQLLREVPAERRRSSPLRRLVRQHATVSRSIADWKGDERDRRRLEREWRRLKREWAAVLEVVEIV